MRQHCRSENVLYSYVRRSKHSEDNCHWAAALEASRRHAPAENNDASVAITSTHGGGGLPGVCELARRLALEPRPARRRATAGGICVPFPGACRIPAPGLRRRFRAFLPPAAQDGSVEIRIAYSACFGPSLPRSNLHCSILGRFLQQYANCRVPLSRQVGDWCVICRRLVNHRSMGSLESVGAWPDGMVFGLDRLAWDGMATALWQSVPGAIVTRLDGRPRRTVPGRVMVNPQISHG